MRRMYSFRTYTGITAEGRPAKAERGCRRNEGEVQADRAPRNKTLNTPLSGREKYLNRCIRVTAPVEDISQVLDKTIRGDVFGVRPLLPCASADLISADPPYSLTKAFSGATLSRMPAEAYGEYIRKGIISA